MSPLTAAYVAGVGVLVGLHVATWGAYKDSPFEGFRIWAFVRSVALAALLAVVVEAAYGVAGRQPAVVLVGLVYALERLTTEGWKLFLREDGRHYTIPMRFAVRGRPVAGRTARYCCGGACVVVLVTLCLVVAGAAPALPIWGVVAVGTVGGWLTAVGGAWKDAPIEGFSGWKFLRSPVVAGAWAVVLLFSTRDLLVLPVAAAGLAVATIETYKTFLTGGRPPGKFEGLPSRSDDDRVREWCRLVHSGVHVACALAVTGLLVFPADVAVWNPSRELSLLVMLVLSASMAALVAVPQGYPREAGARSRSSLGGRQEPDGVDDLRGQSGRADAARRALAPHVRRPTVHGARAGVRRERQERLGDAVPWTARRRPHRDRLG